MSGRTFGVQSSWDDVFRQMGLDVDPASLRKGIGIADSMNQQIEEYINRYVVSSTNDNGSLVFDTSGTYTFNGDVVVNGGISLAGDITGSGGDIATGSTNPRVVLTEDGSGGVLGLFLPSVLFYPSDNADSAGVISGIETASEYFLYAYAPADDTGAQADPAYWSLASSGVGLLGIGTAAGASATWGDRYLSTEGSLMLLDDGTKEAPGLAFVDDTDTGMYRSGTNTIGFSSNSTAIAAFNTDQARFDTTVEVNDGRLWVKNDGNGTSTVLIDNDMLLLTANGMNSGSSKYTPPIVFGSTDSAFTTENPKPLAAIVGVASEAYGNDSDGGMYLEFVINGNTPGAANAVNSSSHGYLMQTSGFKPRNDNVADCGGASNRWDDVYATNGTIVTSDLREKTLLPDERLGLDFLLSLDGIAFTRTGGKRIHHGIAAQQVQAALGPDHAIWIEGDTGVLGVRHDELWGPQINANREIAERLERLEAAIMAS